MKRYEKMSNSNHSAWPGGKKIYRSHGWCWGNLFLRPVEICGMVEQFRGTHTKKNEQTNKQTNQTNRQTNKQTNKQTSKAMKQRIIFIPILNPFTKRTSKECSLLLFWGGEIASFRVCSDADGVWASVKSVLPPKTAAACSACCSNPRKGKLLPNPAGPRRFFRRLDTTGGVDSLIEARHAEFLFVAC